MKRMLFLLITLVGCANDSSKDVLIVGTNAEYPPYTFIENKQIVGFDIDVARQVCHTLGKEMKIQNMPFDALISDLMLHKVDFVAAGMTPTKQRAEKVTFLQPHYSNDTLVVVGRSDSGQCLSGKKVVVNEGYTADLYVSELYDIKALRLPAPADALLALKMNRADVFVTAKSTIDDFAKQHDLSSYYIYALPDTAEGVSMMLSKDNVILKVEIEAALEQMQIDGTLLSLQHKWGLL